MLNPITSTKICTRCQTEYPATAEFFYFDNRRDSLQQPCRACHRVANRTWAATNRDHNRSVARLWTQANKDRARETQRAWYDAHRKRKNETTKAWSKVNRARKRKLEKAWREANPEATRISSQRRRARRLAADGSFTIEQIRRLFELQKGRCWWNTSHKLDNGYHIDHRIALSKGGTNDISNIVLACPHCNLSKHDKLPEDFAGRLL